MRCSIVTAIYDSYDSLKPIMPQSIGTDWICVTDSKELVENNQGWNVIYEPRSHLEPKFAAKIPKVLPWLFTGTTSSIWLDGSFQVKSNTFVEESIKFANPLAQFDHPWRDCVFDEANVCIAIPKDSKDILESQIAHLKELNHPQHWGLWATGVIVRQHTPKIINMGYQWLSEIHRFSSRDQVSHPLVCRVNNLRPTILPGTYFENPWIDYKGSNRH